MSSSRLMVNQGERFLGMRQGYITCLGPAILGWLHGCSDRQRRKRDQDFSGVVMLRYVFWFASADQISEHCKAKRRYPSHLCGGGTEQFLGEASSSVFATFAKESEDELVSMRFRR